MAKEIGVRQGTICRWERGYTSPDWEFVVEYCTACGSNPALLLAVYPGTAREQLKLFDEEVTNAIARLEELLVARGLLSRKDTPAK